MNYEFFCGIRTAASHTIAHQLYASYCLFGNISDGECGNRIVRSISLCRANSFAVFINESAYVPREDITNKIISIICALLYLHAHVIPDVYGTLRTSENEYAFFTSKKKTTHGFARPERNRAIAVNPHFQVPLRQTTDLLLVFI